MALRFFSGVSRHQSLRRGLATVFPTRRTADPAVHSGEPEGIDAEEAAKAEAAEKQTDRKPSKENEPFFSPKPPYASSPRIESTAVNQPLDPNTQQKRHQDTKTIAEEVSCVGLDGTPLPDDGETGLSREQEDNKEYFSHHKASSLSEIEVADTRKPITKATDGTADSNVGYFGGGGDVVLWREEQLDSAEDSLRRAVEMWRQAAMRGDPDTPHGRVLRELRGENW